MTDKIAKEIQQKLIEAGLRDVKVYCCVECISIFVPSYLPPEDVGEIVAVAIPQAKNIVIGQRGDRYMIYIPIEQGFAHSKILYFGEEEGEHD